MYVTRRGYALVQGLNRCGPEIVRNAGPDTIFVGSVIDVKGEVKVAPADYFGREAITYKRTHVSLLYRTRFDVLYPHFTLYSKIPRLDLIGDEKMISFMWGLESENGFGNGLLSFWLIKDATRDNWLYLACRSRKEFINMLATNYMPTDFDTTPHSYSVLLSQYNAVFMIDDKPICFVVFGDSAATIKENVDPWSLLILPRMCAGMNALVEIVSNRKSAAPSDFEIPVGWDRIWLNEGPPILPLRLPLYPEDSGTELVGQSIDGSVTCHPVPVHGYSPAFYFHADGDADLIIEILSRNGNWREYDSDRFTAGTNRIWRYQMPRGSAMIARVRIEPVSPPITVNDAEVILT